MVFRTIGLESTLPPYNDGAARGVSERMNLAFTRRAKSTSLQVTGFQQDKSGVDRGTRIVCGDFTVKTLWQRIVERNRRIKAVLD